MQFQSTLPCGERRGIAGIVILTGMISIHAPLRGATNLNRPLVTLIDISIHAPLRGATRWHQRTFCTRCNFNPRSPAGSDTYLCSVRPQYINFNPRSPAGSDLLELFSYSSFVPFQSTLPCGERLNFFEDAGYSNVISIHAPLRGATRVLVYSPL